MFDKNQCLFQHKYWIVMTILLSQDDLFHPTWICILFHLGIHSCVVSLRSRIVWQYRHSYDVSHDWKMVRHILNVSGRNRVRPDNTVTAEIILVAIVFWCSGQLKTGHIMTHFLSLVNMCSQRWLFCQRLQYLWLWELPVMMVWDATYGNGYCDGYGHYLHWWLQMLPMVMAMGITYINGYR